MGIHIDRTIMNGPNELEKLHQLFLEITNADFGSSAKDKADQFLMIAKELYRARKKECLESLKRADLLKYLEDKHAYITNLKTDFCDTGIRDHLKIFSPPVDIIDIEVGFKGILAIFDNCSK